MITVIYSRESKKKINNIPAVDLEPLLSMEYGYILSNGEITGEQKGVFGGKQDGKGSC